MRWDELFADLEAQVDAKEAADLAAEVADRTRREAGQLRLVDRLLPTLGHEVRLQVAGAGQLGGRIEHLSVDAVLVRETLARHALVPLAALLSVSGISARSAAPGPHREVFERLRLPYVVRGLARDRSGVQVVLRDGATFTGTIDRVGSDFFELAEHAAGEPRRAGQVTAVRMIALPAVGAFFSR